MTDSEQKALKHDLNNPVDLFTLIVENNPSGVSNQMQSWGLTQSDSTPDQMISELVRAYNAGGPIKAQSLAIVRNVQYRFGVFPAGYDEAITGQQAPPKMLTTDGQGSDQNWYADIDFGGIIDSIFGGVAAVTGSGSGNSSGGNNYGANGYTPTPGEAPSTGINPQWIAVGVAGAVLIVAVIIAMRK
jgi:hypothetical protein